MRRLALILFFFSGASGLIYQVVWARMLVHVFGSTATAVGVVLAAFMSGLALGAWLLGGAADRRPSPLRFYAALELGIGVSALLAHLALSHITPVYLALYELSGQSAAVLALTRFVLAFGLVLGPTFLMGATLPVLARFFVRRFDAAGAELGTVYGVNTAGAVAGVLAAGFVLVGSLGIHATVGVAAALNLILGAVAWGASRRAGAAPAQSAPSEPCSAKPGAAPVSRGLYRLLLLGLGVSGLTSFAYEVYWTRSLVFVLGNSTYALTTVLAAFLTGIALGSFLARLLIDRVRDAVALFGWVQVLIGLCSALALPALFAFVAPEALRDLLRASADDAGAVMAARFAVALVVMLVPATLIGATLPLVARIGIADLTHTGRRVGHVYASNTFGNVAGALLPGFVLLPWLGIQRGILLMAALNVVIGAAFLLLRLPHAPRLRWAAPGALAAAALVLAMVPLDFRFPSEGEEPGHRVLYYRDGPSATTKVTVDPETGAKVMAIDGIVIGGNTSTEYKQLLLAHLPKLLRDDVSTELSVGLGSGMLIGESLRHDRVRRVTCVEIEPSVVPGAHRFARETGDVLADPRVEVVVDDIGNFLRTTRERYRVISADEKTALEYASNGYSYSREYYALLAGRLEPGGLVAQWVPANLPPAQYRMVLNTFAGSFPHVLVGHFMPAVRESGYNTILIGSDAPIDLDPARVAGRLAAAPEAFAGLARYGLRSAEAILAQVVATGGPLRAAVAGEPLNTLEHPRYEFFPPWAYAVPARSRVAENLAFIRALRRSAWQPLPRGMAGADENVEARLRRSAAAEQAYLAGYRESLASGPVSAREIFRQYDRALALAPDNDSLRARISLHYAEIAASQPDPRARLGFLRRALSADDENAAAHADHGRLLAGLRRLEPALAAIRRAVELAPGDIDARRSLIRLLLVTGRAGEAAPHRQALRRLEARLLP